MWGHNYQKTTEKCYKLQRFIKKYYKNMCGYFKLCQEYIKQKNNKEGKDF